MERTTLTTKEAAEYIGVGYSKMLDLISSNEVPHIKLGRTYYFKKDFLDRWIDSMMEGPTKEQEAEALLNKKYPHLCSV